MKPLRIGQLLYWEAKHNTSWHHDTSMTAITLPVMFKDMGCLSVQYTPLHHEMMTGQTSTTQAHESIPVYHKQELFQGFPVHTLTHNYRYNYLKWSTGLYIVGALSSNGSVIRLNPAGNRNVLIKSHKGQYAHKLEHFHQQQRCLKTFLRVTCLFNCICICEQVWWRSMGIGNMQVIWLVFLSNKRPEWA